MKKTLSILFIFLVLLGSAYSKSQQSKANVEVIDGVEFIHNTEIPLFPDKTVSFVEDLSLSGEDKDGNIILFDPRLRFVDDNENIYISEFQDQVIKVLDSNGKYIKTIGAKGDGPGEFQRISYLAATKDGILVVLDSTARRTSLFDSSGNFLKSFSWKMGYYNFIMVKNSSYIVGERAYSGTRQLGFFYVKEFDYDGEEVRSYGEYKMPEPLIIRNAKGTGYTSLPVSPSSIFAGDQEKNLFYHCLNNKYLIEVYDNSGKLFRKIDRPYEPIPFTRKDAEEYRARYEDSPEMFKKAVKTLKMPRVKNIVVRMFVDDKSNLWVRTNEKKEKEDKTLRAFDIFDPDGFYYAKVWTEFPQFIFKKGKMYMMDIDDDAGYQTIKRYKVVWE